MELVLLFFGLVFACLRFSVRSSYTKAQIRYANSGPLTQDEFYEANCDYEMEKELRNRLVQFRNYNSVWTELETIWRDRREEIMEKGTERDIKIWTILMEGGRKPLDSHWRPPLGPERKMLEDYKKKCGSEYATQCDYNMYRALHCLMWARGKMPKMSARQIWAQEHFVTPGEDLMVTYDGIAKNKERRELWW